MFQWCAAHGGLDSFCGRVDALPPIFKPGACNDYFFLSPVALGLQITALVPVNPRSSLQIPGSLTRTGPKEQGQPTYVMAVHGPALHMHDGESLEPCPRECDATAWHPLCCTDALMPSPQIRFPSDTCHFEPAVQKGKFSFEFRFPREILPCFIPSPDIILTRRGSGASIHKGALPCTNTEFRGRACFCAGKASPFFYRWNSITRKRHRGLWASDCPPDLAQCSSALSDPGAYRRLSHPSPLHSRRCPEEIKKLLGVPFLATSRDQRQNVCSIRKPKPTEALCPEGRSRRREDSPVECLNQRFVSYRPPSFCFTFPCQSMTAWRHGSTFSHLPMSTLWRSSRRHCILSDKKHRLAIT